MSILSLVIYLNLDMMVYNRLNILLGKMDHNCFCRTVDNQACSFPYIDLIHRYKKFRHIQFSQFQK